MKGDLRVIVVGASGLVGSEVLGLLAERQAPIGTLHAFATDRAAGEEIPWARVRLERLPRSLPPCDVAFLCATTDATEEVAEDLLDEGALVIDVSGAFASDPDVPLVGPGARWDAGASRLIAIAEPRTVIVAALVLALEPVFRTERVVATFLRSASTRGRRATEELAHASIDLLRGGGGEASAAFNVVADPFEGRGRVTVETERLLGGSLPVLHRTVQVPGFHGLGASVWLEGSEARHPDEIVESLRQAPSLIVGSTPVGTREATGSDGILVGEVCCDERWVSIWATGDNLRQGAALTAVAAMETALASRG